MKKLKRLMELIRQGEFRKIISYFITFLPKRIYSLSASLRDKRFGGKSVNRAIPSKYAKQGSYSIQSSDYRCLKRVFNEVPLLPDDLFIDVGCGEGRVLTYLYSKGFRGRCIGIELDEDAAKTAAMRTESCQNIEICCGNVLEQAELFKDATAVYLFNPFSRKIFIPFAGMLVSVCSKPVRLYYLNSLYESELQDNENWRCLSSGAIRRIGMRPMPFSIYELIRP
jgi:SAM-dependent methyltransferase